MFLYYVFCYGWTKICVDCVLFIFNDTVTTEIYTYLHTLSLHDALPIFYDYHATVLSTRGGNRNLDPERARSWTAALAFHPEAIPGLEAELTWFDIDYTDRVVRPFSNTGEALSNAIYAEFVVFHPTAEQQAEFIANAVFTNFTGVDYDPDNVFAMFSQSFINAARQQVRGIDLSGSYGRNVGDGRLTLRGSVSWLDS